MLDTPIQIHLVSNPAILVDIRETFIPITVQGITGDRTKVTLEGTIQGLGITAYHDTKVATNILSYHKLQESHQVI